MSKDARQRTRTLYGGGLILLLVGGAILIFFLDGILGLFDRRYAIVVVMPSAPGLIAGSPVWIGGKEVGTVTGIGFMPTGPDSTARLAITLDLPRSAQPQVRADSRARITSARMIGQPVLDIVPGTRSAAVLAPGDTMRIEQRLTFADLTVRGTVVRAELDSALLILQQLAPPVRVRVTQTSRALSMLEAALADTRRLQRGIQTSPFLGLLSDPALTASLDRSRAHAAELSRVIATFRERAATSAEIRAAVTRLQLRADSVRSQLDATAALLESGSFGRFQRDSALVRAVNAARAELDSLIADTKRNPLRYFFN